MHVPYPWQEHQTGDSGQEGSACSWIPFSSAHLEALGWTVITVWECELRKNAGLNARLDALADEIVRAGELRSQREALRKSGQMQSQSAKFGKTASYIFGMSFKVIRLINRGKCSEM